MESTFLSSSEISSSQPTTKTRSSRKKKTIPLPRDPTQETILTISQDTPIEPSPIPSFISQDSLPEPSLPPSNIVEDKPVVEPSLPPSNIVEDTPIEPSLPPSNIMEDAPVVEPSLPPSNIVEDTPIEPSLPPSNIVEDVPAVEPSLPPSNIVEDTPVVEPTVPPSTPFILKGIEPSIPPSFVEVKPYISPIYLPEVHEKMQMIEDTRESSQIISKTQTSYASYYLFSTLAIVGVAFLAFKYRKRIQYERLP
jgi:hypothetical protein